MLPKPRRRRAIALPFPASIIHCTNDRVRCGRSSSLPITFTSDRSAVERFGTVQAIPRYRPYTPSMLLPYPSRQASPPCGSDNTSEAIHHFSFHPARYRPGPAMIPCDTSVTSKYRSPLHLQPQTLPCHAGKQSGSYSSDTSYTGYFLYLAQLVERFERRERINVDTLDLVPNLHQHGIVELEHR